MTYVFFHKKKYIGGNATKVPHLFCQLVKEETIQSECVLDLTVARPVHNRRFGQGADFNFFVLVPIGAGWMKLRIFCENDMAEII